MLLKEAMRDYNGVLISFLASDQPFASNVSEFARCAAESSDSLSHIASSSELSDILRGIYAASKETVIIIDEYPYLKGNFEEGNLDSVFLREMERMDGRITIIFCGSYISVMENMLAYGQPLYGRFDLAIHLRSFNYSDLLSTLPHIAVSLRMELLLTQDA